MSLIVQFWGALLTQIAIAQAIAIPSTPDYIRSVEAGMRFSLGIHAIPVGFLIASAIAMWFLMSITKPIIAAAIAIQLNLCSKPIVLNTKTSSAQADNKHTFLRIFKKDHKDGSPISLANGIH